MKAIYERELKAYFQGATGYLFIAFVLLFAGIYTMAINLFSGYTTFEFVLGNMSFIFIIVIPILSMRVIAEERRQKTDQLLYALPISMYKIVMGKYLAMVTVLGIPCGIMAFYPLILSAFGKMNFLMCYASLLAFFLLGAALLALGMFISSLTENQVVSAAVCFLAMLLNYFISVLTGFLPKGAVGSFVILTIAAALIGLFFKWMTKDIFVGGLAVILCEVPLLAVLFFRKEALAGLIPQMIGKLSLFERFYTFIDGTCDITAYIYFISVIAVFVYFTVQSMERRRWN